jgi:hypothetical protein
MVITFLIRYGLGAVAIKNTDPDKGEETVWNTYRNYSKVQSISNGRWGDMVFNLPSKRVILGFLFWLTIYAFELLFSLSIDSDYVIHYNGTNCVGRADNLTALTSSMWSDTAIFYTLSKPPRNNTLLRELLNQRHVGNIGLLGNGIHTIAPIDGQYKQNQTVNVGKTGFDCTSTTPFGKTNGGGIYDLASLGKGPLQMSGLSTPNYHNFSDEDIGIIQTGYVNLRMALSTSMTNATANGTTLFLILVSNPFTHLGDINQLKYNATVFLSECTIFYEHGVVTVLQDGYLNETNIGESYKKVDSAIEADFLNSGVGNLLNEDSYFLSLYDYPDRLVNTEYNSTYPETMKIANDIIAAHLLNGLDPNADLCTFNQEQVPVYISALGTRMSFGYILIGVVFAIVSLTILYMFALTMFTNSQRNRWLLYSRDWRFTGYIFTGNIMDKNKFKAHAKDGYIRTAGSNETINDSDVDALYSENLLKKE